MPNLYTMNKRTLTNNVVAHFNEIKKLNLDLIEISQKKKIYILLECLLMIKYLLKDIILNMPYSID